jgi:hypothetical protein
MAAQAVIVSDRMQARETPAPYVFAARSAA